MSDELTGLTLQILDLEHERDAAQRRVQELEREIATAKRMDEPCCDHSGIPPYSRNELIHRVLDLEHAAKVIEQTAMDWGAEAGGVGEFINLLALSVRRLEKKHVDCHRSVSVVENELARRGLAVDLQDRLGAVRVSLGQEWVSRVTKGDGPELAVLGAGKAADVKQWADDIHDALHVFANHEIPDPTFGRLEQLETWLRSRAT